MSRKRVIFLEQTSEACPSQWEGKTEDGDFIYIRYRYGCGYIGLGKSINDAVDNKIFTWQYTEDLYHGYITIREILQLLVVNNIDITFGEPFNIEEFLNDNKKYQL